jgi:hypothetical protein
MRRQEDHQSAGRTARQNEDAYLAERSDEADAEATLGSQARAHGVPGVASR